jgi:signal transduction histidine kinase
MVTPVGRGKGRTRTGGPQAKPRRQPKSTKGAAQSVAPADPTGITEDWLRFSVDSHLVGELGIRLVERDHVALAELIKNSYDADSTDVTVTFQNASLGPSLGRIEISDTGHGMLFDQVKQFWMRVATPNKAQDPESPRFGRPKAGNKGIGRFACQRLSNELELTTVALTESGSYERTTLSIRWADFVPGKDLTEIPCRATREIIEHGSTGLTLRLEGLRDRWDREEFRILRRQLITLTSSKGEQRPDHEPDPGFVVTLVAPEFDTDPRPVPDQVMEAGWGRLQVSVSESGAAEFSLSALDLGATRYTADRSEPLLKGLQADLAFIPRRKTRYRKPEILTEGVAHALLKDFGGVRVYLDGFRVYPYGEPGNDWLDLDKEAAGALTAVPEYLRGVADKLTGVNASRARLNRPRNDQLYGGVNLGRSREIGLAVKASREGFVESPAVAALKRLLRDALDWTGIYYSFYLLREKDREFEGIAKELAEDGDAESATGDPVEAAFVVLGRTVKQLKTHPSGEDFDKATRRLDKTARALNTYFDRTRDEVGALRVTASTGVLMLAFSHDIRSVLSTLAAVSTELERMSGSAADGHRRELAPLARRIDEIRLRLESQLSFWGLLTRLAGTKTRVRTPVAEALLAIKRGFGDIVSKHPVDIDLSSISLDTRTPEMIEGEFYSMALNLLSNALKAVWASEHGRSIRVEAKRSGGSFVLAVLDDGVPVPHSYFTRPPEVYLPDPEGTIYPALKKKFAGSDLETLGTGTGLGLSIVQSIASGYGGTFRFRAASPPWTKRAEVSFLE